MGPRPGEPLRDFEYYFRAPFVSFILQIMKEADLQCLQDEYDDYIEHKIISTICCHQGREENAEDGSKQMLPREVSTFIVHCLGKLKSCSKERVCIIL